MDVSLSLKKQFLKKFKELIGEEFPTDDFPTIISSISLTLVTEITLLSAIQISSWKNSVKIQMVPDF